MISDSIDAQLVVNLKTKYPQTTFFVSQLVEVDSSSGIEIRMTQDQDPAQCLMFFAQPKRMVYRIRLLGLLKIMDFLRNTGNGHIAQPQ